MGNQTQLGALQFAPGTGIAVPKLHKIDRPVKFNPPRDLPHAVLLVVDLDKRAGPDQRIERVVCKADVAVETVPEIEMLDERDRDFSPRSEERRVGKERSSRWSPSH